MTDPSDALRSFQQVILTGSMSLQRGALDPNLFVHLDQPNDRARFTYVRLNGTTVMALVIFALTEPMEGLPCFQVGYAVPEAYRNKGYAKSIVQAAMAELKHGLCRSHPNAEFYVEAVVGTDNVASNRVAALTISTTPHPITDEVSGSPAFHYTRKV